MIGTQEVTEFEHNGFTCTITQRPDLCYVYQVYGFRQADKKHWNPKTKFDKDLTIEQVQKAAIEMMDGTFEGVIEVYGNLHIWAGEKKWTDKQKLKILGYQSATGS